MKESFRMFEVYLGTQRRKEDFFTYFLASCLDYVYKYHNSVFSDLVNDLFSLDFNGEIVTCDLKQLKTYLTDEYYDQLIFSYGIDNGKSHAPNIFREIPLPINDSSGNEKYFLDIGFFIQEPKPLFIGIEGKVTDSSVQQGQLKKYFSSLYEVFKKDSNFDISLFLLNTFESHLGKDSNGKNEVSFFKTITPEAKTGLVLWKQFDQYFKKIQNNYFQYAWQDALEQIQTNADIDKAGKESKQIVFDNVKGLEELLNSIVTLKNSGKKFIGFQGKLSDISLDALNKKKYFKVSNEKWGNNWISLDAFLKKVFELKWFSQE